MGSFISGIVAGVSEFMKPPFNKALVILLLVLGGYLLLFAGGDSQLPNTQAPGNGNLTITFFYLPTCPHCTEQKPIITELQAELPNVTFEWHDASTPDGSMLFYELSSESGLDLSRLGVPTTFVGKRALVGVHSKEDVLAAIRECQLTCNASFTSTPAVEEPGANLREFDLPFIGRMDLLSTSLPVLAVVLGLIDGFNPCAMWVLVYLIALLVNLNDRKKIWVVVGSFVLASGVLYFLFMSAWLNAFLIIGYMRSVTILIGLSALGGGILGLKEYFEAKGALACKVGDGESHKKTMNRLEEIVAQPLSWGVFLAIIALAFVVNSVEFVCSSAIPAVFTQVLALSPISTLEHYAYIALYDLSFMLDDLIIFGLAAMAVNTAFGEKYAKYCKLLGGVIMAVLGLILLFAPQLLR